MITTSESILIVGVEKAMSQVVWDRMEFVDRSGIYDWSREDAMQKSGCGGGGGDRKELEW